MLPTSRILYVLLAGVGAALVVAGLLAPSVLLSGNRLPLALGEATWTITDPNGTRDGEAAPVTRINAVLSHNGARAADVEAAISYLETALSTTGQILEIR